MSDEENLAVEASINVFTARLLDAVTRQAPGRNVGCSPFSVWLPLAALANVTQPALRAAMFDALGCGEEVATVDDLNAAATRLLVGLGRGGEVPVEITLENGIQMVELQPSEQRSLRLANSLWVHHAASINPDFVQVFADDYDGAAQVLDFANPVAVATINDWVAEHTEGLITNLLDHIDPLWAVVIANAIYFRGLWSCQFDREYTLDGAFHAPGGDIIAPFMRFGHGIPGWENGPYRRRRWDSTDRWWDYFEDERMQMVVLPFTTLTESLVVLLPTYGTPQSLLTDPACLRSAWQSKMLSRGELSLPRFRLEADLDLSEILASLGVPLFDGAVSPLADLMPDTEPVWLSKVQQRVMLDVDEHGATAAAVTYGPISAGGIPEVNDKPFQMICDRPFAVALVGQARGENPVILFGGVVNQPEQQLGSSHG